MPYLKGTRILPEINELNRPYWTSGARDELMILRSRLSGKLVHPPEAQTGNSSDFVAEAVSGRGTVFSYTVNYHPYNPEISEPYIVAIVELDEQQHLRVPTNIVNCGIDDVHIGMRVRVLFEQQGELFVPLFEPDSDD